MSNSTDVYWDVDGTSLQTFAFNIESLGGDRAAPPPLRGSNLKIPRRRGMRWMPKVVDSHTITLGMWAIGANEDGSAPTTGTQAALFWKNWRKIRSLLFTPNRQFALTKRFRDDAGNLIVATGYGQYSNGLNPQMNGQAGGVFTVDIEMADPYFYGAPVYTSLTTGSNTLTVAGDDHTTSVLFHLVGSRNNTRITNTSLNNLYFEYPLGLASGDALDVDIDQFTATTSPSGSAAFTSSGSIRHAGNDYWFRLRPGSNAITVASDSGLGGITMTHYPVYY